MAETIRTVLPLKDIQQTLESRITMLQGIRASIEAAAQTSTSSETRAFNAAELQRADEKLVQLQQTLDSLNAACCPTPMDCPHDYRID